MAETINEIARRALATTAYGVACRHSTFPGPCRGLGNTIQDHVKKFPVEDAALSAQRLQELVFQIFQEFRNAK